MQFEAEHETPLDEDAAPPQGPAQSVVLEAGNAALIEGTSIGCVVTFDLLIGCAQFDAREALPIPGNLAIGVGARGVSVARVDDSGFFVEIYNSTSDGDFELPPQLPPL